MTNGWLLVSYIYGVWANCSSPKYGGEIVIICDAGSSDMSDASCTGSS